MKILINLYCFCSVFLISTMSFAFSGGTGTAEDPYLLRTCPELQSMISFPSAHFQLADNINCNGFDYGDGGGFMPVGSAAYPFIGILDGNGFTISNLNINRSTQNNVGLIGEMRLEGTIKNLAVTDAYIIGRDNTGGIVGYAGGDPALANLSFEGDVFGNQNVGGLIGSSYANSDSESISNSHVIATVTTATNNAGGLIGNSYYTNITNSSAAGEVKSTYASGYSIGGLVGYMYGTNVVIFDKNFANSVVTGYRKVGGLIGDSININIKNSYADSSVYGTESVGGLIAYISNGSVVDSYAKGEAHADHYVGGLIGQVISNLTITNSYAAAKVTGSVYAGGLVGYKSNYTITANNSYWDTIVSGQPFSAAGTPKTTIDMYQQATYVNWNFNNIWQIDENVNYPYLRLTFTEE